MVYFFVEVRSVGEVMTLLEKEGAAHVEVVYVQMSPGKQTSGKHIMGTVVHYFRPYLLRQVRAITRHHSS